MSKTGYTFDGWYNNSDFSGVAVTFPVANVTAGRTYWAKWTPTLYAIRYTLDGGTVATANPTEYTIETASFTLTNPTKTGHTFIDWTGSNGTTPQTSVSVELGSIGDINYSANWEINTYAVTLPSGDDGYTVIAQSGSSSPVDHGGSYSFIVTIANGYSGSGLVVKANDVTLTADDNGVYTISNITSVQGVVVGGVTSIASRDRVIPTIVNENAAVIAPAGSVSFEVAAGPNPVQKSDGAMKIFASGKPFAAGSLTIYDATGNVVRKINIRDNGAMTTAARRIVGEWDLRDARGRAVAEGSYLVRGVVKTVDGKRERVSVVVGVR